MKRIILLLLSVHLLAISVKAEEPLVAIPRVEYPTQLIGQFMSFCVSTMNARASIDLTNQYVSRESLNHTHSRICACIIDSYRYHNMQAVFDREFIGETSEDVPLFKKYLRQCGDLSNRQAILQFGS